MRDVTPELEMDGPVAGPSSSRATFNGDASPPGPGSTESPDSLTSGLSAAARTQLVTLRLQLSPLVGVESTLADRLSGGAQVSALAKRRGGGVYVRSGWQSNVRINGRKRRADESDGGANGKAPENARNQLEEELDNVARMLNACQNDIKALWNHPFVKLLIDKRKLRLQESADQYV